MADVVVPVLRRWDPYPGWLRDLAEQAFEAAQVMMQCCQRGRPALREPAVARLLELQDSAMKTARRTWDALMRQSPSELPHAEIFTLSVDLAEIPCLLYAAGARMVWSELELTPATAHLAALVVEGTNHLHVAARMLGSPAARMHVLAVMDVHTHANDVHAARAAQLRQQWGRGEALAQALEVLELLRHASELCAQAAESVHLMIPRGEAAA
ncbi:MAG: hypothetical protein AB2A00_25265 [Myxococcota bacterium]